ncbi:MAG: hypothetical protein JZU62_05895 [Sulfuricurvum sp.]|uniref:hypothetical protein n=1 Tax=Sulfuricurvum sp. TaxID=2025608 RepID=UPI0025E4B4C3|nr:hypothetical protein [Sulfuricurvum sp.]MBV5321197.1 hypothetical protein [Sulfuricurvum sp.]
MLNTLNQQRLHYQETLIKTSADYHYRFNRYKTKYSVALAYISEENGDLSSCGEHLRESDTIIFFQPNFCGIVFDNTNDEEGIKAANNILSRVQNLFFAKHFYMATITATAEQSEFQMIHDLFDLIAYALEHNMDNLVVDASQIIQHKQSL